MTALALLLPTRGTTRRLQALQAMGWDLQAIGADWRDPEQVARLYDELGMRPGPSQTAREIARECGWLPPLAWDDIDLDETPPPMPPTRFDSPEVDPIAVERALTRVDPTLKLNRAECLEVVRALVPLGFSSCAIAKRCNVAQRTVTRWRTVYGIG